MLNAKRRTLASTGRGKRSAIFIIKLSHYRIITLLNGFHQKIIRLSLLNQHVLAMQE
jgi:hypothetical protein